MKYSGNIWQASSGLGLTEFFILQSPSVWFHSPDSKFPVVLCNVEPRLTFAYSDISPGMNQPGMESFMKSVTCCFIADSVGRRSIELAP